MTCQSHMIRTLDDMCDWSFLVDSAVDGDTWLSRQTTVSEDHFGAPMARQFTRTTLVRKISLDWLVRPDSCILSQS